MTANKNIRNLSRAASLIAHQIRNEAERFEDLRAFHAPNECYPLVECGDARERRRLARRIKGITGYSLRIVLRELEHRTSSKWVLNRFASSWTR